MNKGTLSDQVQVPVTDSEPESEYAWASIRPRFLAALQDRDGSALTYLDQCIALLQSGMDGIVKTGRTGGVGVHASDTYESLVLLRRWWMPLHLRQALPQAGKLAASELRGAVVKKTLDHAASFQSMLEDPKGYYAPAFRESLRNRVGAMAQYHEDQDFVARAAFRMESFDPRSDTRSPAVALLTAVYGTLVEAWERDVGASEAAGFEGLTVAEAIRRSLRLPADDPQRRRITDAIDALPPEHRDYLYALLLPGGSVRAARHAIGDAGGPKEDRVRREALQRMSDALPELARLPVQDPTRVGRKKAHD